MLSLFAFALGLWGGTAKVSARLTLRGLALGVVLACLGAFGVVASGGVGVETAAACGLGVAVARWLVADRGLFDLASRIRWIAGVSASLATLASDVPGKVARGMSAAFDWADTADATPDLLPAGQACGLLITVDSLRADYAKAYIERTSTPGWFAFKARALEWTAAESTSAWLVPAVATILTGATADVHDAGRPSTVVGLSWTPLSAAEITVAEELAKRDFVTTAVLADDRLGAGAGFGQGFHRFENRHEIATASHVLSRRLSDEQWLGSPAWRLTSDEGGALGATVAEVLDLDRKFNRFVWLHLSEPAAPYGTAAERHPSRRTCIEPDPFGCVEVEASGALSQGMTAGDATAGYGESVHSALDALDNLFATMSSTGDLDRCITILVGTHGQELGERGVFGDGNGFPATIRSVPLWTAGPGQHPGQQSAPVLIDEVPALLREALDGRAFVATKHPRPLIGTRALPEVAGWWTDAGVAFADAGGRTWFDRTQVEANLDDSTAENAVAAAVALIRKSSDSRADETSGIDHAGPNERPDPREVPPTVGP